MAERKGLRKRRIAYRLVSLAAELCSIASIAEGLNDAIGNPGATDLLMLGTVATAGGRCESHRQNREDTERLHIVC